MPGVLGNSIDQIRRRFKIGAILFALLIEISTSFSQNIVIVKTNQTLLIQKIDPSKQVKQKSPLGINGLKKRRYCVTALRDVF